MSSPLILITNDDGIYSKGLRYLVKLINPIAKVVVVAPDSPQSAQSHAITINQPITCEKIDIDDGKQIDFICSGTPVDCVKLALAEILDRKPDLCISGINHGSNASVNVIYSGTVSAAVEASVHGIPSLGFSILDYSESAELKHADNFILHLVRKMIAKKSNVCLNVNIPQLPPEEIKGIKICRQAKAYWADNFDKRYDQFGKPYYWLTGDFNRDDWSEDTDIWALDNGYVSIVPTQFDMTAYHAISELNQWGL